MFSWNHFCVPQRMTCKNLSYWFLLFVTFQFLEECFFTSCFFASDESVLYNEFLLNWLKNSFCQPWLFQIFFPLILSLVIGSVCQAKYYFIQKKFIKQIDVLFILRKQTFPIYFFEVWEKIVFTEIFKVCLENLSFWVWRDRVIW